MKIKVITAALIALTFASGAYANCCAPQVKFDKTINIMSEDFSPLKNLYVSGSLPGPFIVYEQNAKTCRTSKRMQLTEDQLFDKYGVADELENGDIESAYAEGD